MKRYRMVKGAKLSFRVRIPRPGCAFTDKSKYRRKVKHRGGRQDG